MWYKQERQGFILFVVTSLSQRVLCIWLDFCRVAMTWGGVHSLERRFKEGAFKDK